MSLREIVVTSRQPPELVRKLYREWLVSLADGEYERHAQEVRERERREELEDQRMNLEQLRLMRS